MTNNDSKTPLDKALEHVSDDRRDFLKRLLGGTAIVAALPFISTDAAAQPPPFGIGKGLLAPGFAKGVPPAGKGGGGYVGKGGGYVGKGGGYAGKGGGGRGYSGKGGGRGGGKGGR